MPDLHEQLEQELQRSNLEKCVNALEQEIFTTRRALELIKPPQLLCPLAKMSKVVSILSFAAISLALISLAIVPFFRINRAEYILSQLSSQQQMTPVRQIDTPTPINEETPQ